MIPSQHPTARPRAEQPRRTGALLAAAATLALLGCNGKTYPASAAPLSSGSGGATTTGAGGAGASTTVTVTASAGHGAGGATTSGSGSGAAATSPCTSDVAFWATSMGFTYPTAAPLAAALSEVTYAYEPHPLSLVLRVQGGVVGGALSATEPEPSGLEAFPAMEAPDFTEASITGDTLTASTPQLAAYLRVADQQGTLDVPLEQVRWTAKVDAACAALWVMLDAQIPPTESATVLHLESGPATLGALAGDTGGAGSYPIHAWFAGESMSFDFAAAGQP